MQNASKSWGRVRRVFIALAAVLSFALGTRAQDASTATEICARYAAALQGKPQDILAAGKNLAELGPAASPALPSVLKALDELRSSEVRTQARELLDSIGIAALEPLLRRQIDEGRSEIDQFEPRGEDVLAQLWNAYDTSRARERTWIAVVLDNLGQPSVEELVRRLKEESGVRRMRAAQAARAFAWRRAAVVDALAPLTKDADAATRYWATFALGGALPESLPHLLDALASADPRVRIAAAEGIEKSFDAVRSSPSHPDVEAYEAWHGVTRDMNRESRTFRAIVETGVPKLTSALSDAEPLVRMFAAVALEKIGTRATAALDALEKRRDDPDPAVRMWVQLAMQRIGAGQWAFVESFVRAADSAAAEESAENVERWLAALDHPEVWEPDPDEDWNARDDVRGRAAIALTCAVGRRWLDEAKNADEDAAARVKAHLERIDDELWRHVNVILWISQSNLGTLGPASDELERLGSAALPNLRHDYLRYPRFPIGDGSYDVHVHCLPKCGEGGLATLAHGLEHWYGASPAAADALAKSGEKAAHFAPLIVSSWRCLGATGRAPGTEAWWDGAVAQGSVVPDGWSIEESGGGSSEWGNGDLLRRVSADRVARAFGVKGLPAFAAGLVDEHAVVRARCAASVGALGADARSALPSLVALLDDEETFVRVRAAHALIAVAPADAPERTRAEVLLDQTK